MRVMFVASVIQGVVVTSCLARLLVITTTTGRCSRLQAQITGAMLSTSAASRTMKSRRREVLAPELSLCGMKHQVALMMPEVGMLAVPITLEIGAAKRVVNQLRNTWHRHFTHEVVPGGGQVTNE